MKCIFCLESDKSFYKTEHIIPESLGGEITLKKGLVCDQCNQYFGQKIEHKSLLNDFLVPRIMSGTKSKKGKYPQLRGDKYTVQFNKTHLELKLDDTKAFEEIRTGKVNQFFIRFDSHKSSLVRLLLKMGLEFMSTSKKVDVYGKLCDGVRYAVRNPKRGTIWEYAVLNLSYNTTVKEERILYSYNLYITKDKKEAVFVFRYYSFLFAIPLLSNKFESFF